jgi:hypothetical protein
MLKEPVVTGLSSDASGKLTATFSDKSTKVISVLQPPPKSDTNTADWTLYPRMLPSACRMRPTTGQ